MKKPASPRDLPPPPIPLSRPNRASAQPVPQAVGKNQTARSLNPSEFMGPCGRYSIVAMRRDGATYPGDILRDTIEYRGLRATSLQNALEPNMATRLAQLEERLRQAASPDNTANSVTAEAALRAFQRYNCRYLAALRYADPDDPKNVLCLPVWVADISAGGVKIAGPHVFEPGLPVVLHIRDTGPECVETQLPSRIAWTADAAFGLMFAGPPRLIQAPNQEFQAA